MPNITGAEVRLEGGDEDDGLELQQVIDLAGFLVRAPRRRPKLAAGAFVATLTLGALLAVFWPRTYACDVRILAQRNLVLPALDNPSRAVPHEADAPTKNAADAILQRDNLVTMVRQLDLVERWQATRRPITRLKDELSGIFASKPPERERDMVDLVAKKLSVFADESSITISIEWAHREMALDIVSFLQRNFFEARYDTNVNVILEAARILEERAKPQAAEVDAALAELTELDAERNRAHRVVPGSSAGAPSGAWSMPRALIPQAPPPHFGGIANFAHRAGEVAEELQDVRRRIRATKEERERQLVEAQRQLVDARATLGPLHPTVLSLKEKLAQLGEPPPELKTLDLRERDLVAQIAAGSSAASAQDVPAPASVAMRPSALALASAPVAPSFSGSRTPDGDRDDPKTAHARQKLQTASTKYNELLSRIEAANIELAVARASFKYQYTVVRPPELPRGPLKPNVMLVVMASIVLALLIAMLLPGLLDLLRGPYIEPWQVERSLKMPVLGELTPPR
jgi:hypothetical protein